MKRTPRPFYHSAVHAIKLHGNGSSCDLKKQWHLLAAWFNRLACRRRSCRPRIRACSRLRVKLSALPPDLQNFPRSLQRPRRRRIQIYCRLLISTSRATSTRVKRGPNLKIKAYKAMYKAAQTAYAITSFFAATSPRLTEAPQPGRLFNPQSYTSSVRSPAGRPTYSFGSKTGPSGVRDSGGYRDISDRRASPEMLHGKATLVAAAGRFARRH